MIERRIKELAIALEALSRINQNFTSSDWFEEVESLMGKLIQQAKKEADPALNTPPPPPPPALWGKSNPDDNIPF